MHRMRRVLAAVTFAALAAGSSLACGAAQTASPHDVLRIPDERTATGWIAKAFRKQGIEVEGNREVSIGGGVILVADVAGQGEVWGVAWLRPDEVESLSKKLPTPPPSGALWVISGSGDDAAQRVLVLIGKSFEYDPDPRGKGVVRSIEESEARVIRDVTDFVVRAKAGEIE